VLTFALGKTYVYFGIDAQPFQALRDEAPTHRLDVHSAARNMNTMLATIALILHGVFERAKQKACAIRHVDSEEYRE
jgi:hypothetical protein